MVAFEKEILESAGEAEDRIRAIIQRIQTNTYENHSKNGILKQDLDKYANCIRIDVNSLRRLLEIDSQDWRMELDLIKQKVQQSRE